MESTYRHSTLHQLRVFSALARYLASTQAAAALRLTQSAVSAQMRELAAILGVPILEVVGKKVHLTDAGGRSSARGPARRAARRARPGVRRAARRGDRDGAHRRETALGNYLLPALIAEFVPAHPRVEVSLCIGNSAAVVEWLLQNEVDLGFVGSPVHATTLIATPFFEDEIVFACAPGHPLAAAGTVPLPGSWRRAASCASAAPRRAASSRSGSTSATCSSSCPWSSGASKR